MVSYNLERKRLHIFICMETKICTKCKLQQPLTNFYKHGKYLKSNCKSCNKLKVDEYYKNNNKKLNKKSLEWKKNNPEKAKGYALKSYGKQKLDKDKIRIKYEYNKKYHKQKYKEDIQFKIKRNIRNRIHSSLKNIKKSNYTIKYLGCTIRFYIQYLEDQFLSEMMWRNHGIIWEIDHKIPISKFDLTNEKEKMKAFNYKNTEPLFKTTQIAESFGYVDIKGNRNKKNNIL